MTAPFQHSRHLRSGGFSLVEIAVVLVIIGLILAVVLQGRKLISSAEYKSLKQQLSDYQSAFYAFRDRYHALPGDFADANNQLGVPNGNGNGAIGNGPACTNSGDESCLAWRHLRAAGLIKGNPSDQGTAASPQHPYGGVVSSFFTGNDDNGVYENKIYIKNLPIGIARQLDRDLDDEQCNTGRIAGDNCDSSDPTKWPSGNLVNLVFAL